MSDSLLSRLHTSAQGHSASGPIQVLCLCAEWCGSYREYRATFDALKEQRPGCSAHWIDIEELEDYQHDLDISTFPTILILNAAGELCFSGPVTPHAATLLRLCDSVTSGALSISGSHAQTWQPLLKELRTTGRVV
ncbi:MAG: hypothetical protein CVU36_12145 [Betaproteobacteria bacterium HGW-Betaproteobacteria-9]|jgi:hypothetical protein|nr:MAG: hypothetical protein CVU36_12145 [Betaproteobacteria bacterium HGW-Betaproteobacteria-9]